MSAAVHVLARTRARVGESPLWLPDERAWLWLDLQGREVHRYDPARSEDRVIATGFQEDLACLARLEPGACFLASVTSFHRLDTTSGATAPLPCPVTLPEGTIFNDGKVDRHGALWIGSSDRAEASPIGSLWRITSEGAGEVAHGFVVSNGPAFAPDGSVAYFADTLGRRILRFSLGPDGRPGAAGVFAAIPDVMGLPDGLTVDAVGDLWVGHWDGAQVTRWSPGGELRESVPLAARNVTALSFGGEHLRDALVTTAGLFPGQEDVPAGQHGDLFGWCEGPAGIEEPVLQLDWPSLV